jgi:hypothetical protein
MGLFDFGRPSGGLLGHVSGAQVPDAMSGINEALLRNAQMQPSGGGIGGFLTKIGGVLGDAFTGNPAYANTVWRDRMIQQQMQQEAEQRQRQRAESLQDFEAKERIKQQYDTPDIPSIAKEEQYWRSIGRDDIADDVVAKHRMATVSEANPLTGEVRYRYVRPAELMGGGGGARRVSSKEEYDALPPNTEYIAPDGSVRRKGGAGPAAAPQGFPGPY